MTTETPLLRHPFMDPIHDKECTLLVDPALRLYDALKVVHPDCSELATVSADLDAFYCTACGWNGRVSGAWAVDMWEQGQYLWDGEPMRGLCGHCPVSGLRVRQGAHDF